MMAGAPSCAPLDFVDLRTPALYRWRRDTPSRAPLDFVDSRIPAFSADGSGSMEAGDSKLRAARLRGVAHAPCIDERFNTARRRSESCALALIETNRRATRDLRQNRALQLEGWIGTN